VGNPAAEFDQEVALVEPAGGGGKGCGATVHDQPFSRSA
jgi:hypothetical protein